MCLHMMLSPDPSHSRSLSSIFSGFSSLPLSLSFSSLLPRRVARTLPHGVPATSADPHGADARPHHDDDGGKSSASAGGSRLYGVAENDRWSCLLTDFCPSGDLRLLCQRQPNRRFPDSAISSDRNPSPSFADQVGSDRRFSYLPQLTSSMEPLPPAAAAAAKYAPHFSKIRLYPGSYSFQDPDIMQAPLEGLLSSV